MKSAKKLLALLLVLSMCVGLCSSLAFAADDQSSKKAFNVVTFGGKTANGFGLADYGAATKAGKWVDTFSGNKSSFGAMDNASASSYIDLIGRYVNTSLLASRDVRVKNLSFEGMRVDELRALLQPSYLTFAKSMGERGDTYLTKTLAKYNAWFAANADKLDNMTANEYFKKAVQDADVIILDMAMDNFYDYLSERLQAVMNLGGYEKADYSERSSDFESQLDIDIPTYEAIIKSAVKQYIPESINLPTDEIIEALAYCYCDFRVNFQKDIQLIRELNQSAKVIAVGGFNTMTGLRLNFDGERIDLSSLWITISSLINNFITDGCDYSATYFYASVAGGVNTLFQELANTNSIDSITPTYADALVKEALNNRVTGTGDLYVEWNNELRGLKAEKTVMEINSEFDTPEYSRVCARINEITGNAIFNSCAQQAQTALESYIKAAHIPTIDGRGAVELLAKNTFSKAVALNNALFNWDSATDAEKALAHVNARFIVGESMGSCPNETGCATKYDAVKNAYIKVLPANTDHEGSLIGTIGGAFSSIVSIFKTPLLENISAMFKSFSLSSFMDNIRNAVSDWFVTIFPRN